MISLAYYRRAKCYEKEGRYKDALLAVREYIRLEPEGYKVSRVGRVCETDELMRAERVGIYDRC
jgi:tetratricopeptide (TPR) repeat protein